MTKTVTPSVVAERYGCKPETVIGWIRAGELRAIDVSSKGSKKPRFRIDEADLAAFEAGRVVGQKPTKKPRRRKPENKVIRFF